MPLDDDILSSADAEDRFETLFEQAPFSVQLLSPSGRTLRVNRAWKELWDSPDGSPLLAYVLGSYDMLADPQLEAKGISALLRRAFAGESVELPAIRYDPAEIAQSGRARWVRAYAHPIREPSGSVREVMLIHEDVTERMVAEEALRGSEQRLKQLANTIPQLAWMADPSGRVHWYNDRWYDYTGATIEDMERHGWESVLDPTSAPMVAARWKASLETDQAFEMTFPIRGKDGVLRPFLTLVAPLKDDRGEVVQWFGTNTDVSELQAAERSARTAEERLRAAVRAGKIGVWAWEVERNVVEWSEEVYDLHGVPPGSFGGTAEAFAALVHPEDRGPLWQKIEAAVAAEGGFEAEFRIVLPHGQVRWLSTWAMSQRETDGLHRMIGATLSIDDYKRAEASLREADRRKDEFLAMLAHELRNPLAPIRSSSLILDKLTMDGERARSAVDTLLRQTGHLGKLVDDLLDVSRVTRGVIDLQLKVLDLATVVDAAIEQVGPLIASRSHRLHWEAAAQPMHVRGDEARLVQAVANLLTNAAKYTQRGGTISIRAAPGEEQRKALLQIEDDGVGIDPDFLPHVFELFSQATRDPDRTGGGLGIGLSLSRQIVRLHGGDITARSAGIGHGSTFSLELPTVDMATELVATPMANTVAVRPTAGASRVMLVDDNVDSAQALAELLTLEGHETFVAHDGPSTLNSSFPADFYVLDIGLPGMDGYELARRLKDRRPNACLIALTGYGQPGDRMKSREAGFAHHLVKPVDLDTLLNALNPA